MRDARSRRLDENLAVAALTDILWTVGVDLPLAAQVGGGHPGFQRLHARIGLGICHRTLPVIPAVFSDLLPRHGEQNSMATILTCQRPPSVVGSADFSAAAGPGQRRVLPMPPKKTASAAGNRAFPAAVGIGFHLREAYRAFSRDFHAR